MNTDYDDDAGTDPREPRSTAEGVLLQALRHIDEQKDSLRRAREVRDGAIRARTERDAVLEVIPAEFLDPARYGTPAGCVRAAIEHYRKVAEVNSESRMREELDHRGRLLDDVLNVVISYDGLSADRTLAEDVAHVIENYRERAERAADSLRDVRYLLNGYRDLFTEDELAEHPVGDLLRHVIAHYRELRHLEEYQREGALFATPPDVAERREAEADLAVTPERIVHTRTDVIGTLEVSTAEGDVPSEPMGAEPPYRLRDRATFRMT